MMERIKSILPYNAHGYIVGSISTVLANILLSETVEVVFSEVSLEKNFTNHPELSIEDYLLLPEIIGKSHFMIQDGDKTVAVVLEREILYHYALKCTKSGETLFLMSFRKTSIKDVKRLRKKATKNNMKILKDIFP